MPPRTSSRGQRGFIWLPRTDVLDYDVKVNGESVRINMLKGDFTRGVCPEVGMFEISLINANEFYSERYAQAQPVQLLMDFGDGSTLRFEGKIESLKNKYDEATGFTLNIMGGHLTRELMDILVTESFEGQTINSILDTLESTYLTSRGFTLTITGTFSQTPTINWDNKPFWDCINDLTKIADADAYCDNDKDVKFFASGSVENNNEAVIWNDTLIRAPNIGDQTMTVKNRTTVYGDDGTGLPVIYTVNDTGSQATLGSIKERAIFDSKVNSLAYAQEIASAENIESSTVDTEGDDIEALILPSLQPGDKIWFTNPVMRLTKQIRVYQMKHTLPDERTFITFNQERKEKQLFKRRIENELATQKITNPHRMQYSFNMVFDDTSELLSREANVRITGGKISLSSGSQGTFTSIVTTADSDITEVHLKAVGVRMEDTTFKVSADGGNNYQTITLDSRTDISTTGKQLVLQVIIQNSATEIDSIALLYK